MKNSKFQVPNSKQCQNSTRITLRAQNALALDWFGVLVTGICLEFGVWSLERKAGRA